MEGRRVVISNFFGEGENLYEDQLGWTQRERQEARSFVSKEIFDFEVVTAGQNLAFYYVDNDTFYGIHTEEIPIEVKILPRDNSDSPYINSQCSGDTHADGEVIFSFENAEDIWNHVRIDGKTLEEFLNRSYIITLN